MKVIGERGSAKHRPLKYFNGRKLKTRTSRTRTLCADRTDCRLVAALLNILRDDRDSTVNRATARRARTLRPVSKVIGRSRAKTKSVFRASRRYSLMKTLYFVSRISPPPSSGVFSRRSCVRRKREGTWRRDCIAPRRGSLRI